MRQALIAVAEKQMGWQMASKHFNVPQATLRRRANNKNKIAIDIKKHLGRHEASLNADLEKALVEHILALESRFFGLTTKDVRILAYELAEKLKINHQFNKEKRIAGKGWLRSFRSRNKNLSLRRPEATSMARAEAFNKPQVEKYFRNLEHTISKENIDSTMIFNMDESAITTVQTPPRIFALKGKKQVGSITSGERGVHSSVVVCMSSAGSYIPPAIIFPRKKYNPTLYDGAPAGTLPLYNESGYMTGELFIKWMQHFIAHVRPTPGKKALLILDGHVSHKNVEALDLAKQNSVVLFCLPSHCTHRLQPLDVSFFGPLSKYYDAAVTKWLKTHAGRPVSLYQVASLFAEAYGKTATNAISLSGFKATGISPFNANVFPEHMFLPSTVTDVPQDIDAATTSDIEEPHSSTTMILEPALPEEKSASEMLLNISPLPHANTRKCTTRKKNSYQDILTASPYLESLREKEINKKAEELRKSKRKTVTKKVFEDSESDEPFNTGDDDSDCPCLYCNEPYSNSKAHEGWLCCQKCRQWAHAECAGLSKRAKQFICELCAN